MGIFDFFKKNRHKECRNNQHTTEVMEDEEEEADLWAQAYMAKPHCYTKEGKKPILSFVVTEGINTILPMYPNELYRKGKNGFADIHVCQHVPERRSCRSSFLPLCPRTFQLCTGHQRTERIDQRTERTGNGGDYIRCQTYAGVLS